MARGRYGSGEAVVLDFSPVTAYLAQQEQYRLAQQQQLDKQINEDMSKLSFDGARTQDYSAIRAGYDSFKNAAIQYKKALRDPKMRDGAEQEYLNAKANLNSLVNQSKEAKGRTKDIYEFYAKNRDQINGDEFKKSIDMINAPIGSDLYNQGKDYDITKVVFKPEQFDANKWTGLLDTIKSREVDMPTVLPNGQIRTDKKRIYDPTALRTVISQGYNSDYVNAKKYYDNQFKTLDPTNKSLYEEYAKKYFPDFKIEKPEDLAVAANLYGKVEQDLGSNITGVDRNRIEAHDRWKEAQKDKRQRIGIAAMKEKDAAKNYYVVDDIVKALSNDDSESAIAPLKAEATQGVIVRYISDAKQKNKGFVDRALNELKKDGVDSDTRMLTRNQVGKGVIIVGVPKIDPETKEVIKGQYDYMAVPKGDKFAPARVNALINYAKGADAKLLPQKYYKGKLGDKNEQILSNQAYGPAELDDVFDEDDQ